MLAATPDKFSIDYRVLGGTGETRWVSSRGRVVERDAEGRALRSVVSLLILMSRKTQPCSCARAKPVFAR
ncbi:MAG: PAS domain-containing protein [Betaproteobacteria bacterium]|nr:PAS domain-containing protein [Betaproteobacteria bacterium]